MAPFEKEAEITGHIVAHLNISDTPLLGVSVPQDIDLFLTIRHFDAKGEEIFYTGTIGNPIPLVKCWQRVSLHVQSVIPGEVYPVDVEIWPTNVVVEPGACLVLDISGGDTPGVGIFVHDGAERTQERFGEINHIHFAPHHQNYITLPIIPS
ncbi:hypothetical protein LCI18_000048 [Fusarium solani-melongenae]|uniref:Uncharacterized protein n=1 Tax=Fusarium solani subsp. cucurbitae TaxID=2747967 RepID=A0ACD3YJX1_FUSSC|nr:hypothetical protein LCI18_000048 [Fusarium solani-melongenae]